MLFLARELNPEDFGSLSILIAISNLSSLLMDFGTNTVLVREIATKKNSSSRLLIANILLKIPSAIICLIIFQIMVTIWGYNIGLGSIVNIFAIGMILESFFLTLTKYFEGSENMKLSSILIISERILIGISVFSFSYFTNLVDSFGYSYLISNGILVLVVSVPLLLLNRSWRLFNRNDLIKLFKLSIPFFIVVLFSIIYNKADIFIISLLIGDSAVGYYRAGYQLVESFYFISISLSVSLLPFFSRMKIENIEELKSKYSLILKNLFFLGIFLSIILIPNSDEILNILYKNKYQPGQLAFSILLFSIPLYYSNIILGNLLIAIGKEKIQVFSMAISTIAKIILLYFLINGFGIEGAAISVILAELIALFVQSFNSYKLGYHIQLDKKDYYNLLVMLLYFLLLLYTQNFWYNILSIPVFLFLFRDLRKSFF